MKDIELLQVEMDTGWGGPDDFGREDVAAPPVAVAIATDGQVVRGNTDGIGRTTTVRGGPSFLVETIGRPPDPTIATSDRPVPAALRDARPERWWEPQEWSDLLDGKLGPWAIALGPDRVSALCHTPRARDRAAEAGVWTHPDHRRRGHAAAVTTAWAAVARSRYDVLFYSTSEDNVASQGVARTLGLRPIGWIWQLRNPA
jgi:RimJ/RimL family protein N-acetyltransferase